MARQEAEARSTELTEQMQSLEIQMQAAKKEASAKLEELNLKNNTELSALKVVPSFKFSIWNSEAWFLGL